MEQLGQFIINHWALCLALVVLLIVILGNELITQRKNAKQLSPSAAVEQMNHEDAKVIDLRDAATYNAGHIVGAIRASAEDFNQQRMDKYKDKPLILVCPRGLQSAPLATKLRTQGFTNPQVLAGGMAAWLAANLPVIKSK